MQYTKKRLGLAICGFLALVILFLSIAILTKGDVFFNRSSDNFPTAELKLTNSENPKKKEAKIKNECSQCLRRRIDGVLVESGLENFYPQAVIIENHPDSRPPSGLSRANLVYEAPVEGGITRFLAIYAAGQEIKEIGPIRSIRPYFIDWAEEFKALIAHCGGSPDALAEIAVDKNVYDLNEFYHSGYFWRDLTKLAPHNVYTSSVTLYKFFEEKPITAAYSSWKYKDDLSERLRPKENNISIIYSSPNFVVQWKYDILSNSYLRIQSGIIHLDKDGKKIQAKNIIIEFIRAEVIDDKLRIKLHDLGEGKAITCFDGSCRDGKWRKPESASRTLFYDNNGQEIAFNAGTTWIEIVRPEQQVNY